ncbi:MAG: winged helix-turn-helix domain-containing protein [Thermoanaerobaculia bacterium]
MKLIDSSPFGGRTRTRVLVALSLLETSFPRELARLLAAPVSSVRQALASLERDGLVAGRLVGKTRLVRLDPGYFARRELEAYLARLAATESELRTAVSRLRRRPRAAGKPA